MPTSFASDLASILGDTGTAATLKTVTSVFDPATGTNTNTETSVSVTAMIAAYTLEETDGSLVQRGDLKATIPAAGLATAPTTSALFGLGSETWAIKSVQPRYAGGSVLSFALQLRK